MIHVLAWRFAKVSSLAETAKYLRQITSDVMSHAQIPANAVILRHAWLSP